MLRRLLVIAGLIVLLGVLQTYSAGAPADAKTRRAKPPRTWSKDVLRVFSPNPKSQLVGERPDFQSQVASSSAAGSPGGNGDTESSANSAADGWSKLISADVLADEVKENQRSLAPHLATVSAFNGGGFRDCRQNFSILAVVMAITAEYDGDARWKKQAAGARDLFARAGANLKVASDASYKEAKLRLEDLETMIRGGNVDTKPAEEAPSWDQVADFTILMKRLEVAHKDRLNKAVSNENEFKISKDIEHEAQIIAAFAELIKKDGYDYAGDETFAGHANEMKRGALETIAAVKSQNYEQARAAVGVIYQSCEKCHSEYR